MAAANAPDGSIAVLAVADLHDDLTPLVDQLTSAVSPVDVTTDEDHAFAVLERQEPLVLALAYSRLEPALVFYLRARKRLPGERTDLLQTILLCDRTEAREAFNLCRDSVVDDYLVTRPIYDPWQLALAVKQARDRLAIRRWMLEVTAPPRERKGLEQCLADLDRAASVEAPDNPRLRLALDAVRTAVDDLSGQLREGARLVEQTRAGAATPTSAQPPAVPSRASRTILVVDDDEFARRFVSRTLESEGYRVLTAENGLIGLAALGTEQVDLVLMDVEMPGLSGLDTARHVRQRWAADTLPIVMLTAHGDRDTVVNALAAGASDFVVKPGTRASLLAKVRQHLNSEKGEGQKAGTQPIP
jgi:CheY-like chemotaxis protein